MKEGTHQRKETVNGNCTLNHVVQAVLNSQKKHIFYRIYNKSDSISEALGNLNGSSLASLGC